MRSRGGVGHAIRATWFRLHQKARGNIERKLTISSIRVEFHGTPLVFENLRKQCAYEPSEYNAESYPSCFLITLSAESRSFQLA